LLKNGQTSASTSNFNGSKVLDILWSFTLSRGLGRTPQLLTILGDLLSKYSIFKHVSDKILPKSLRNLFDHYRTSLYLKQELGEFQIYCTLERYPCINKNFWWFRFFL